MRDLNRIPRGTLCDNVPSVTTKQRAIEFYIQSPRLHKRCLRPIPAFSVSLLQQPFVSFRPGKSGQ